MIKHESSFACCQGDRVILGGDHYFRLNHPLEVQKGRTSIQTPGPGGFTLKDFEFARQELITVQNERSVGSRSGHETQRQGQGIGGQGQLLYARSLH